GIDIDVDKLSERLGVQVVGISARNNTGLNQLKEAIGNTTLIPTQVAGTDVHVLAPEAIALAKNQLKTNNDYFALQVLHQYESLDIFSAEDKKTLEQIKKEQGFESSKLQAA